MPRAHTLPAPGSFRAWVLACRPATLSASSVPVLVGTACAFQAGGFELGPALAALVGAGLLQIGSDLTHRVATVLLQGAQPVLQLVGGLVGREHHEYPGE